MSPRIQSPNRPVFNHGKSVLSSARTGSALDPHVYRDWLIFEERLKQNYKRLKKKKQRYMLQLLCLISAIFYTAYLSFFEISRIGYIYYALCGTFIILTYKTCNNRAFVQSVKFQAQCNRVLHQFRMRFDPSPIQLENNMISHNQVQAPINEKKNASKDAQICLKSSKDTKQAPFSNSGQSQVHKFMTEPQIAFFPAVPRNLRDGYMQFKSAYFKRKETSKRRLLAKGKGDKKSGFGKAKGHGHGTLAKNDRATTPQQPHSGLRSRNYPSPSFSNSSLCSSQTRLFNTSGNAVVSRRSFDENTDTSIDSSATSTREGSLGSSYNSHNPSLRNRISHLNMSPADAQPYTSISDNFSLSAFSNSESDIQSDFLLNI